MARFRLGRDDESINRLKGAVVQEAAGYVVEGRRRREGLCGRSTSMLPTRRGGGRVQKFHYERICDWLELEHISTVTVDFSRNLVISLRVCVFCDGAFLHRRNSAVTGLHTGFCDSETGEGRCETTRHHGWRSPPEAKIFRTRPLATIQTLQDRPKNQMPGQAGNQPKRDAVVLFLRTL